MSIATVVTGGFGPGATIAFVALDGFGISSAPPPPPPPVVAPSDTFGGFGSDFTFRQKRYRKKSLYEEIEDKRTELAALAEELRDALDGPRDDPPELPQVSEAQAVRLNIDPRIAQLLAKADDAPLMEFRGLVEQALAEVEAAIRDEEDVEVLLLGLP